MVGELINFSYLVQCVKAERRAAICKGKEFLSFEINILISEHYFSKTSFVFLRHTLSTVLYVMNVTLHRAILKNEVGFYFKGTQFKINTV